MLAEFRQHSRQFVQGPGIIGQVNTNSHQPAILQSLTRLWLHSQLQFLTLQQHISTAPLLISPVR